MDLPVARTGVTLYHSPRFSVRPEPGAFRVNADAGPFTATLRDTPVVVDMGPRPHAPLPTPEPPPPPVEGDLIEQYRKDVAGRAIAGPLPVAVPFPRFGASVFLMSELTAELAAPTLQFSYKREVRW